MRRALADCIAAIQSGVVSSKCRLHSVSVFSADVLHLEYDLEMYWSLFQSQVWSIQNVYYDILIYKNLQSANAKALIY